jgi:hypothetical protein
MTAGGAPERLTTMGEWRVFLGTRYRPFQGLGLSGAVVAALAGDGLTIPLLLALGASPAVATVIGVLPYAFSSAQLGVPWLLHRFDGNLRGVTLIILAVGETRGFILGGLTLAAWVGLIPNGLAILAIGAVMSLGGAATTIGGTNLLAWYGAILPDPERRFVAPRVMGMTLGLGSILLLPVAVLVQLFLPDLGVRIYAIVFLVSGVAGVAEIVVLRQLAKPGRVRVAGRLRASSPALGAGDGPPPVSPSPHLQPFLRSITVAAFGAGFGPYLSIYAISVLGLPPSYAILLSAISSAASLVSATIVGGLLARGSASRTLRVSFLLRGSSMLLGLTAFPANPLAGLIICVVAGVAAAGASAGTLSSNERLMRLTPGPDLIRAQGRFVAGSAAGITAGQLSNAAILAILPLGYPAFAILFAVSGLTRFATAVRAEVSETWSSSTRIYRNEDLRKP